MMNQYDDYINDYFTHGFVNMRDDHIPRDFETENQIMLANKIEYYLQNSIKQDNLMIFKNSNGILPDKRTYKIEFITNKYFNRVKYYKSDGSPDLLLDIQNTKNISIVELRNFPLVNLFRLIEKNHISKAINRLSQKLNNKFYLSNKLDNLQVEKIFSHNYKDDPFIRKSFDKSKKNQYKFHYIDQLISNFMLTKFSIRVEYLDKKKIVIPYFYGEKNKRSNCCNFYPLKRQMQPLFNNTFLSGNSEQIVILTDSIELAGINQQVLERLHIDTVVWISWYGEKEIIPSVNWELLKGRRIYFLLKEHSGFGGKNAYETANAVKSELDKFTEKDKIKEFKFISYLANGVDDDIQSTKSKIFPDIYTVDEFELIKNNKIFIPPFDLDKFKKYSLMLANKRKILMTPFIREISTTLIHGNAECSTWFALNFTYALSLGKRAFEGWNSREKDGTVLYCYGEDTASNSLDEKLSVISQIFKKRAEARIKQAIMSFASSNFSSKVINKKQNFSDSEIIQYIKSQINVFQNINRKLIVLDNLFSGTSESMVIQNNFLKELKKDGWAIVIVDSTTKNNKTNSKAKKMLAVENIVKVKKCKNPYKLKMSVNIEKSFGLTAKQRKGFHCELDSSTKNPTWKRVKDSSQKRRVFSRAERDYLKTEIRKWHYECEFNEDYEEKTGLQVAARLKITPSMFKKLKDECRLSKKHNRS